MGTRADFYIGSGSKAEWLGSVGWDGYEWEEDSDCALMKATTADEFRAAVGGIATEREDFTAPKRGWPWPWPDSSTTDRAYMLIDGSVWVYHFGKRGAALADFPDMRARQNVTLGAGSGLIVLRA